MCSHVVTNCLQPAVSTLLSSFLRSFTRVRAAAGVDRALVRDSWSAAERRGARSRRTCSQWNGAPSLLSAYEAREARLHASGIFGFYHGELEPYALDHIAATALHHPLSFPAKLKCSTDRDGFGTVPRFATSCKVPQYPCLSGRREPPHLQIDTFASAR